MKIGNVTIIGIPNLSGRTEEQKQHAVQWVTALRSGSYKQGYQQLKTSRGEIDSFCCLGVAGDCMVKNGKAEWSDESLVVKEREDSALLNNPAVEYFGLKVDAGFAVLTENERGEVNGQTLPGLNDIAKASFNQIADIVEIAFAGGYSPLNPDLRNKYATYIGY